MADGVLEVLEAADPCSATRNELRHIAKRTEMWAGIPFTLERGPHLIVEPSYPLAEVFNRPVVDQADDQGLTLRSSFHSFWWRCEVVIYQDAVGRVGHFKVPHIHSLDHQIATMMATEVWGIEQEQQALKLLGTMIPHKQFKCYLLTGSFLETSARSGVTYVFRRLRPTIAVKADGGGLRRQARPDRLKILASLCMHPIGYYEGSWAGAMCPTDDIVAHLAMMRGDEHMLWRRCNQHPPHLANAGI